jgi:DNA modification methylase
MTFETTHRVIRGDARDLAEVADGSVQLIATSPPYPMIAMWDAAFAELAPAIGPALAEGRFGDAFEAMHGELDRAWRACHRVLADGCLACVNVGDATRTAGEDFRIFPNHARVIDGMVRAGFVPLPDILWRKPTNAPSKFMGSGMLPAGAYVTYEHEYVLVFRKGSKRRFDDEGGKALRRRSAYFWEERNAWFSDVWSDLTGVRQELGDHETRARSAAFPFEIPYRLIQMFSVQGDVVLDPFAGLGTTSCAALASGRSSIAVERDPALVPAILDSLRRAPALGDQRVASRLEAHRAFVEERRREGRVPGHVNVAYGFPVVTGQETDLVLARAAGVRERGGVIVATHELAGDQKAPGQQSLFG